MKPIRVALSVLALTSASLLTGVAAWASSSSEDPAPDSAASATAVAPAADPTTGFFWQLTAPQPIIPGAILIGGRHPHSPTRGTRSDEQFFQISSTGSNDVPKSALRAYHHAAQVMATSDPSCHIPWTLLAAIGRVESNHGRFGGAQLGADGVSRPMIRGPQLNGDGAFAAIHDTDHGALDHDPAWDRAVGQMQFLPETWQAVARDGDGDGKANPDDLDDSALGAAVYLCGAGGNLADPAGMARAAFRYNHSDYYVQLVLSYENGYQTGVFAVASPPPPGPTKAEIAALKVAHERAQQLALKKARAKAEQKAAAAAAAADKAKAKAHGLTPPVTPHAVIPTPSTQTAPTPSPAPGSVTNPVPVDGTWSACGASYCLDTTALDLGPPAELTRGANADFDGDGTVETNTDEFSGLLGTHVTLQARRAAGVLVVFGINAASLRNQDGSFARKLAPATAAPTTP